MAFYWEFINEFHCQPHIITANFEPYKYVCTFVWYANTDIHENEHIKAHLPMTLTLGIKFDWNTIDS